MSLNAICENKILAKFSKIYSTKMSFAGSFYMLLLFLFYRAAEWKAMRCRVDIHPQEM